MKTLKDQVVWITGASSGIGAALSRAFAKAGARLVLSARRQDKLEEVAASCNLPDAHLLILPIDLEHSEQAAGWVAQVMKHYGRIDLLINNAGIGQIGYVADMTDAVERRIMEINYFGQVNLTRAVLPHMQQAGSGRIVIVSSILGKFGMAGLAAYAASKHAVAGYFESLRAEIKKDGLTVLIVSPGFIKTDVTKNSLLPDGRVYQKDSPAQEKGMPTDVFAKKFLAAVKSNRKHVYIGRKETLAPTVKWLFPGPFYWLMAKIAKKKTN
jgi:dehydrogenase/reductase SDR family protein 7B